MIKGDRFATFEQNLLKLWVLLNHGTFGAEEQEKELLNQIKQNFESDGWKMNLRWDANKNDINIAISELNKKIKKDVFEIIANYQIEVEENGGAYTVDIDGGKITYPVLEKNK